MFADRLQVFGGKFRTFRNDHVTRFRIGDRRFENTSEQFILHRGDRFFGRSRESTAFANEIDGNNVAIFFPHDNILRDVDETTGQVTGVRRTKSRIGQTFTRAVRRCEVVQNGQTFTEVRLDRQVDDPTGRVGHQAAHAGELTDLLFVTAGTGLRHHGQGVEFIKALHHFARNIAGRFIPNVDRFAIAFIVSNQTALEEAVHFFDLLIGFGENGFFRRRHFDVGDGNRHTGFSCIVEAERLHAVKKIRGLRHAEMTEAIINQTGELFLVHEYTEHRLSVFIFAIVTQFFR